MKQKFLVAVLFVLAVISCSGPKDGTYTFQLFTTNDVHGRYFDSLYVGNKTKESLLAVNAYVDSVRKATSPEDVILVDAGDCMQGDNAAYYYNYIDTVSTHLYARMVDYMHYDAVAVGNHDIETGHSVYDRVAEQMKTPFLAANAVRASDGKPYFPEYTVLDRHGLKILIIGYTNPNIKNWLSESLWSGIEFRSLIPEVQSDVDRIVAAEKPHLVIVAVHSGTGDGDGSSYESQGMDLFKSLKGVDFLVCSHDHRPFVTSKEDICLINSGSHCRNIGHGVVTLEVKDGKVVSKKLSADLIKVDRNRVDLKMRDHFRKEYEAVKAFTIKPVGKLERDMFTRHSFTGMCDYMNLLHTLSLSCTPAQISFSAPLTFNGKVKAGTLIFNDLFTIYPFENQLFVVKMTGKEIKDYLEYSYAGWVNQVTSVRKDHLLKIKEGEDHRTGQKRWSFVDRSYNFDSAAGIIYTVDVTRPAGSRVSIESMADGTPFDMNVEYNVAMTSYRASGGGGIMRNGAGIDTDRIDERVVARYPEIREILYEYLMKHESIDPDVIGNTAVIGSWKFVPEKKVGPMLEKDMELLFGR